MSFSFLPTLNAMLNATSALFIIAGFFFIRRNQIKAHRACMIAAVVTSILFLVSYITYHINHGSTRFQGAGTTRAVYFIILISHTILAVTIVPFVIVTLRRALRGQFLRHRAIARWTFPMWLYVSVTGVIVYLMLYQWFPTNP